jgi:RND family efflux transporter MFP subunit
MNSTWHLSVLALVLILAGCGRPHEAGPPEQRLPSASVRVAKVEERSRLATEEIVGTVRAKLRASIEAKVSGRIEQMTVEAGQAVKAGQLLAQLDAQEIQARREQALATQVQTERDLQRFTTLLNQKTITQQEFDAVQARQLVAKAALSEAETMLGYTKVTAPFDGIITRKLADVGDLASPGRALLELEDPRVLRVEADVSEGFLGKIQTGDKMAILVPASTNRVEGVVSEISPAVDPGSRTFRIKLDLPSSSGLRAGQFGRVLVPAGETSALRVPASAIVLRGQMELAFVVQDGRAQLRIVKTGKRLGDEVEVVSGLTAGELIVVEGATSLRDGQPVEVRP